MMPEPQVGDIWKWIYFQDRTKHAYVLIVEHVVENDYNCITLDDLLHPEDNGIIEGWSFVQSCNSNWQKVA